LAGQWRRAPEPCKPIIGVRPTCPAAPPLPLGLKRLLPHERGKCKQVGRGPGWPHKGVQGAHEGQTRGSVARNADKLGGALRRLYAIQAVRGAQGAQRERATRQHLCANTLTLKLQLPLKARVCEKESAWPAVCPQRVSMHANACVRSWDSRVPARTPKFQPALHAATSAFCVAARRGLQAQRCMPAPRHSCIRTCCCSHARRRDVVRSLAASHRALQARVAHLEGVVAEQAPLVARVQELEQQAPAMAVCVQQLQVRACGCSATGGGHGDSCLCVCACGRSATGGGKCEQCCWAVHTIGSGLRFCMYVCARPPAAPNSATPPACRRRMWRSSSSRQFASCKASCKATCRSRSSSSCRSSSPQQPPADLRERGRGRRRRRRCRRHGGQE